MPAKNTSRASGTVTWTGENVDEVTEFCGLDRLGQPRVNVGRFWDGSPLLFVWTPQGSGSRPDRETTLPVRVGETIARDDAGRITVVGIDTSDYE